MKKILFWIIIGVIAVGLTSWMIYRLTTEKKLELVYPNGGEVLKANETFKIAWKSRNISKVGIILIKGTQGKDAKWIVKDVSARSKKYDWKIFVWEQPGQDYKVAIFEYPWKEGNLIDYSDDFFTILGPEFASCDSLSVAAEWPFLPSDFPNLRKVFISSKNYTGNLERLEGADKRCQEEAQEKGFSGDWKAFLGDDTNFAADRLKLDGIFVSAEPAGSLPEGKTCHRLLGTNFDEFWKKLSEPLIVNNPKFEENLLKDLKNMWLGRINSTSTRECVNISFEDYPPSQPERNYSFTTTCQNWTTDLEVVPDYRPGEGGERKEFPVCFTPQGLRINAVGLAGLASGVTVRDGQGFLTTSLGKLCNVPRKLLCLQQ